MRTAWDPPPLKAAEGNPGILVEPLPQTSPGNCQVCARSPSSKGHQWLGPVQSLVIFGYQPQSGAFRLSKVDFSRKKNNMRGFFLVFSITSIQWLCEQNQRDTILLYSSSFTTKATEHCLAPQVIKSGLKSRCPPCQRCARRELMLFFLPLKMGEGAVRSLLRNPPNSHLSASAAKSEKSLQV